MAMTMMVFVRMAMACIVCMAVMASHAQGQTCNGDLSPYKPCMAAVVGDTPPLPTSDCCDAIKAADLICLCSTVAAADIPALNEEAALMLPKRCGIISPDSTTCGIKHKISPFARKLMDFQT